MGANRSLVPYTSSPSPIDELEQTCLVFGVDSSKGTLAACPWWMGATLATIFVLIIAVVIIVFKCRRIRLNVFPFRERTRHAFSALEMTPSVSPYSSPPETARSSSPHTFVNEEAIVYECTRITVVEPLEKSER